MVVSETHRLRTLVGGRLQQYRNTVVLVWSHYVQVSVLWWTLHVHVTKAWCVSKLPIHSFSLPPKALCHILHLSL